MKYLLVFLLVPFIAFSQKWTKIEGVNPFVNTVEFINDETFIVGSDSIATDLASQTINLAIEGEGYLVSNNRGESFEGPYLDNWSVYDLEQDPNNPNKWFMAIRDLNRGRVLRSNDGAQNWGQFEFLCDGTFQILNIVGKDLNGSTKYFAGAVNTSAGLRTSDDDFETCIEHEGLQVQVNDISISPINPNIMYAATNNLSPGQVYRSLDGGETWHSDLAGLEKLRIHTVVASSNDERIVIAGADSVGANGEVFGKGIYSSLDTGRTWTLVGCEGLPVYDIEAHPTKINVYAAACGVGGVYVSASNGGIWEEFNEGLPVATDIRNVTITPYDKSSEGGIIMAGSFGSGLFLSEAINATVSVNPANFEFNEAITITPQPVYDKFSISFSVDKAELVQIFIYDIFGKEIVKFDKQIISGDNKFEVNFPTESKAGTYFISIRGKNFNSNSKFIKY